MPFGASIRSKPAAGFFIVIVVPLMKYFQAMRQ
jgi:hypothetical protein